MSAAPLIGITTYGRRDKRVENPLFDEHYASPALYTDAVRRAGGVPVLLPPGGAEGRHWLARLDGIIVTGGADVDPNLHGGDADHPDLLPISPERDGTEMALARLLAERDTPALFVCRGMQVLNVALGGTLLAHIPDAHAPDIHRGPDGGWTQQEVFVTPGAHLAGVMRASRVVTASGHHQAVERIGDGLTPVAQAPDGVIEALELPAHPWLIAVQWHPEVTAAGDVTQQRLFDALVRAAATRKFRTP